ncbi:MAG: hypothetical protein ACK55Z_22275 [bacterium]
MLEVVVGGCHFFFCQQFCEQIVIKHLVLLGIEIFEFILVTFTEKKKMLL